MRDTEETRGLRRRLNGSAGQLVVVTLILAGATVLGLVEPATYGECCRYVYVSAAGFALGRTGKP